MSSPTTYAEITSYDDDISHKIKEFKVKYCIKELDEELMKQAIREEEFTVQYYDTKDCVLAKRDWFLHRKNGILTLVTAADKRCGVRCCSTYLGENAKKKIVTEYGEQLWNEIGELVCIKVTRVIINDNYYIDFCSWGRWKIGYYAVETYITTSIDDARALVKDPAPCKIKAHLHHTEQVLLPDDEIVGLTITDEPLYGHKVPTLDLLTSSDDDSNNDQEGYYDQEDYFNDN